MEFEDPELEPTILPVEARLSIRGLTSELKTIFDRLAAIAPQKEKIPGTSNVHVSAEDDIVRFTATDGHQILVIETNRLRVVREGKSLLPAQKMKSIFSLAPDERTTLTVLANTATVSSGRALWNIATTSGDKAPAVPDISTIALHEVPRRSLYKALSSTKRALPHLGGRKSLEQALVAAGSVTCSDGYRILRQRVDGLDGSLRVAIPKDTVEEFLRTLSEGSTETVLFGADLDLIVMRDGENMIVARQLRFDYPDLEQMIITPSLENETELSVNSVELRDLVKRVRVSADPEYFSVTLHFQRAKSGEWELTVLTRDRAGNSASETMEAIWEGSAAPFDIVVNHKYLVDLLDAYPGSLATLRLGTNTKTRAAPLLLRDDERGFIGVIQQSTK